MPTRPREARRRAPPRAARCEVTGRVAPAPACSIHEGSTRAPVCSTGIYNSFLRPSKLHLRRSGGGYVLSPGTRIAGKLIPPREGARGIRDPIHAAKGGPSTALRAPPQRVCLNRLHSVLGLSRAQRASVPIRRMRIGHVSRRREPGMVFGGRLPWDCAARATATTTTSHLNEGRKRGDLEHRHGVAAPALDQAY